MAASSPSSRVITNSSCFTENKGQWNERVLYKAELGNGITWWFERDGLTFAVTVPDTAAEPVSEPSNEDPIPSSESVEEPPQRYPRKGHALKLLFVPSPRQTTPDQIIFVSDVSSDNQLTKAAEEVIAENRLAWNNNYFLGNDQSKWAPDCANYTRLTYRNVWDGIDVVYYMQGSDLKYDYVIHPSADLADIRLRWLGLEDELAVENDELLLATTVGVLREAIPDAYQRDESGSRVPVEIAMRITSGNEYGFVVTEEWNGEKELVIDPLVYSTFLGGSGGDVGYSICVDDNNGLVVAGLTSSEDFPITQGAIAGELHGRHDTIVTRFTVDGSQLIFSTYLGGSDRDYAFGICTDGGSGFVFTGYTLSDDFPTTNGALDREFNDGESISRDVFIARINDGGNQLIYSTYFGGSSAETSYNICPDSNRGVFLGGVTYSTDLPTTDGAFRTEHHGGNDRVDAFIVHLNARMVMNRS